MTMRDEKVHAVVAQSTFLKHTILRTLLEAEMSKKCTPLWGEAHAQVKSGKIEGVPNTFGHSGVVLQSRHKRFCTFPK